MERIDKLDRQILEIISQNARTPFKDVAADCGVSRAAIHQRVQRLIDMGVIIGSGYNVNPKTLGYNTCTYVGIKLEKGSMYKDAVKELKKIGFEAKKTSITDEETGAVQKGIRIVRILPEEFKRFNPDIAGEDDDDDLEDVGMMGK